MNAASGWGRITIYSMLCILTIFSAAVPGYTDDEASEEMVLQELTEDALAGSNQEEEQEYLVPGDVSLLLVEDNCPTESPDDPQGREPVYAEEQLPVLDGYISDLPVSYSSDIVQRKLAAMEDIYYVGYPWNDYTSYTSSVFGTNSACVGFAYMMSDAAFDDLPYRTLYSGSYTYEDIHVGDLLWVDGGMSHMVVIIEKYDDHILVAEGNYWKPGFSGYGVNWRRSKTKQQVMSEYRIRITRYPVHLAGDVSGNKLIDEWDAACLLRYLTGERSGQDTVSADANSDSTVNCADAAFILQMNTMKQDGLFMRQTG